MAEQIEKRKRILSGIQPTGTPTLGNYIGAVRNWALLQSDYDCLYMVADLHSLTVRQNPAELRRRTRELAALLLAVTLGPGVDAQIRRAGVGDIAAGVASDALGSALAEQAAEAAEAELRQWAARQGKYLTGRYSPGYGDWPLAVQPLLAAALDTARRAGLCVTENNLMTPRKSITAILGVSDHPVRGHLAGCGHCVLRTRCEYRKRGITCASE